MDKKQEPKISNYRAFIKEKHERLFNTPRTIIDDAVRKATCSSPITLERVIKGEANEVHAVKTDSGQEVIIRISREGSESQFQRERWAIEQCTQLDIPVPRVLLLETVSHEDKWLHISIEERLPGIPLDELAERMDKKRLAEFLKKAGLILSRIHIVKTNGFGAIDKDGNGKHKSIADVFSKRELKREELITAAQSVALDPEVIERSLQILQDYALKYPTISPRLIHGDYGPKHILVDKNEITGIIDFEDAHGGDPIQEFARWEFFYEDRYPLSLLKEGYENKEIFKDDFEQRFRIWKLYYGLVHLSYYVDEGNQSGIDHSKDQLPKDLKYFDKK